MQFKKEKQRAMFHVIKKSLPRLQVKIKFITYTLCECSAPAKIQNRRPLKILQVVVY